MGGCLLILLRPVLTLALGVLFFVAFLWWGLQDNVTSKLLTAEFYTDTISQEDAYNRIYDQVLLDEELEETTQDLLGGVQVVSQAEIAALLRDILPPDYLQSQTEVSIQRTVEYFRGDRETLDIYVALGPPLDNVRPVVLAYIDQRIDGLEEQDLGRLQCTEQQANDVADIYRDRWQRLSQGEAPSSIPSLASFEEVCRETIFELAFEDLLAKAGLDNRARQELRAQRGDLKEHFRKGEAKEVLKLAARPLAGPLIDDAIQDIRDRLDSQDRFDLIRNVADWNNTDEQELRADLDSARDVFSRGRQSAKWGALVVLVLSSVFMLLLHFPRLKNGLLFLGFTMFSTGLFFYIAGRVAAAQLPGRVRDLVELGSDQLTDVPPSITELGEDLLVSFGKQLVAGVDVPALVVLIVGVVVFGTSFFVDRLLSPLRSLWDSPGDEQLPPPKSDAQDSGEW